MSSFYKRFIFYNDTQHNSRGVYRFYMLIDSKGEVVEHFEGFREEFLEKVRKKVSKE